MNPYFSTEGQAAAPEQILLRREARAEEQRRLLTLGGQSLISFTMNIPGACKSFPLATAAFDEGMAQIRQAVAALPLLHAAHSEHAAGCEAFFLLDAPAREVKRCCVALERSHPLGRLWDIDVLRPDGTAVSRRELGLDARRCLLCGREAKLCARSRAHGLEEIRVRVLSILGDFFCAEAADAVGSCAERALFAEVCTTPKPGLVDRRNNGSHSDMALATFARQHPCALALVPSVLSGGLVLRRAAAAFSDAARARDRSAARNVRGDRRSQHAQGQRILLCRALRRARRAAGEPPRAMHALGPAGDLPRRRRVQPLRISGPIRRIRRACAAIGSTRSVARGAKRHRVSPA